MGAVKPLAPSRANTKAIYLVSDAAAANQRFPAGGGDANNKC